MAHFDEEEPKKAIGWTVGEDLSKLSIDELEERISHLRAEIIRIEEALAAKRESHGAAAAFFKS